VKSLREHGREINLASNTWRVDIRAQHAYYLFGIDISLSSFFCVPSHFHTETFLILLVKDLS